MRLFCILCCVTLLGGLYVAPPIYAKVAQESTPSRGDPRIRHFTYHPNEVYSYTGYYRYASFIEFSAEETIQSIVMGDPTAWQIVHSGNRLFLKPIDQDPTTNMTVLTNERTYFFELHAEQADDINTEGLAFTVQFIYPTGLSKSKDLSFREFKRPPTKKDLPNYMEEPGQYNFRYSISGDTIIAPLKIFDDGEFTYMEFRDVNAVLPAIFLVDKNQDESLINYRIVDNFVIIERVAKQFTLRHGKEITCIFNEGNPYRRGSLASKKKVLGF